MYYIKKSLEISGAHRLRLDYESKCTNLHGHNWLVDIYCKSKILNTAGMIVDFTRIKEEIHNLLDHKYINSVISEINPTAENMAKWICDRVANCYMVTVEESRGNVAVYTKNDSTVAVFG